MVSIEILLIIGALLLQPIIAATWCYVVYRFVASYTSSITGNWVDDRVQNASEELKP